jgi:hypothetical protein
VHFLEDLRKNPSFSAQRDAYRFIEANDLPIRADGAVIAYKLIRQDWTDVWTGKISNKIGAKPEMPRSAVDDDNTQCCSRGFHACGFSYLRNYHGQRLVAIAVKPSDIVSVPLSYEGTKMRICKYEVIEELDINLVGGASWGEEGQVDVLAENKWDYQEPALGVRAMNMMHFPYPGFTQLKDLTHLRGEEAIASETFYLSDAKGVYETGEGVDIMCVGYARKVFGRHMELPREITISVYEDAEHGVVCDPHRENGSPYLEDTEILEALYDRILDELPEHDRTTAVVRW